MTKHDNIAGVGKGIDIEEIERELTEIQEWPWECDEHYDVYCKNPELTAHPQAAEYGDYKTLASVPFGDSTGPFIAKSPQRLAALVERIRELEQKLKERKQEIEGLHKRLISFYAGNHPNCIQQVVGITEDEQRWNLMILKEINSNEGVFLEVHLPSLKSSGEE